jgi:tetratricopeptide (TPR) repeat protein
MRPPLITLIACVHAGLSAAMALASSAALADATQDCRSGSPEMRVGGCSRLLAEARTPRQRAIALDGRCWANIDRGSFADALADCNSAIRADDQYPYAFHNRGVAYAGLQNPTAAITDFNRALAMRPTFWNTLLNRAKANISLGNTQAAARDYEEVLRLRPDNEEAKNALAMLRGTANASPLLSATNSLCGSAGCN